MKTFPLHNDQVNSLIFPLVLLSTCYMCCVTGEGVILKRHGVVES